MNELLHDILLFLHFVGLASLVGGLLLQVRAANKLVNPAVFYGALGQLVTGLALMFLELDDIDHVKVAVKFAVLTVIIVIGLVRRRHGLTGLLYWLMLGLSVANVGIAVFW